MKENDFCPLIKGRCQYDSCMFWSVVRVGCYVRDALACYVLNHEGQADEVTEDITLYNVESGEEAGQEFVQASEETAFFQNLVADIEEERTNKNHEQQEQLSAKTQRQIRRETREKQPDIPQNEGRSVVERLCKFLGI